jgi:DNA-directed RNA polymerase sigma subunit (sigma70/sigma32)
MLEEIRALFNVARKRVRRIETRARNNLRHPSCRKKRIEFFKCV